MKCRKQAISDKMLGNYPKTSGTEHFKTQAFLPIDTIAYLAGNYGSAYKLYSDPFLVRYPFMNMTRP